jgi:phosphoadenosine phosphosulfate reductase
MLTSAASSTTLAKFDLAALARASAELESKPAGAAIRWAWDTFGTGVLVAASFQDTVLIDVAVKAVPEIEVVFLDTGYHFAETLWFVEKVRERYDLNLTVTEPLVGLDDMWQLDQNECCAIRKVEPLARALGGRDAWISGVRRSESPSRATAPIAHLDVGRGIVKVNPLAPWSELDVEGYIADHHLLVHPLKDRGYPSIGCWPCTRPVREGEDARAGRWSGTGKTECGLHGWPDPTTP